jgi:tRNA1(Val) A37 N6-methylase TrmN6
MIGETTNDGFLGQRIILAQPKKGFRAGHDSVLLAAAVPAQGGERVAELGSGGGVVSLCLAARLGGISVRGVEIDGDLVHLANENAARNAMSDRVAFSAGEALAFRLGAPFDHIFFNPPFHPDTGRSSPNPARERAMREESGLIAAWVDHALSLIRPDGTLTLILRADGVEALRSIHTNREIRCRLLLPHRGATAKRAILHIQPRGADFIELAPLVLHQKDGKPTEEVEAVLRRGKALMWGSP